MISKKDRSNLAGEFYTLAELYRKGYNAFITLGKAKQIDIVVAENDKSIFVEVKARMSSSQFLCTPPSSPDIQKIWCFVDMNEKEKNLSDAPDYYILSAQDLIEINKNRVDEITRKGKERGKNYAKLSEQDVTIEDLKKYNREWNLIKEMLDK